MTGWWVKGSCLPKLGPIMDPTWEKKGATPGKGLQVIRASGDRGGQGGSPVSNGGTRNYQKRVRRKARGLL